MENVTKSIMKKIILLTLTTMLTLTCNSQKKQKIIAKDFINTVKSNEISFKAIINDKMTPIKREDTDSKILVSQLSELRKVLQNCNEVKIITYKKAEKNNLKRFFQIENSNTENVFFIECKNEFIPILIEKDKISSFTTIRKGNIGHFLIL